MDSKQIKQTPMFRIGMTCADKEGKSGHLFVFTPTGGKKVYFGGNEVERIEARELGNCLGTGALYGVKGEQYLIPCIDFHAKLAITIDGEELSQGYHVSNYQLGPTTAAWIDFFKKHGEVVFMVKYVEA